MLKGLRQDVRAQVGWEGCLHSMGIEAGEGWKASLFWGGEGNGSRQQLWAHPVATYWFLETIFHWKKLWRAGWFRNSGRESTRWTWNIILCQKVRGCLKNDRICQKNRHSLEGSPTHWDTLRIKKKKCADYNPVNKTRIFESTLMQTYPYIHNLKAYWGMGCWQSQRIFLWKTYKLQRKN